MPHARTRNSPMRSISSHSVTDISFSVSSAIRRTSWPQMPDETAGDRVTVAGRNIIEANFRSQGIRDFSKDRLVLVPGEHTLIRQIVEQQELRHDRGRMVVGQY